MLTFNVHMDSRLRGNDMSGILWLVVNAQACALRDNVSAANQDAWPASKQTCDLQAYLFRQFDLRFFCGAINDQGFADLLNGRSGKLVANFR